ncbi:Abi-like protein [Corynebacterium glaucum]|uniref:Abi-like protein n=1 Tax=Corynebacterium glaucum TaxID=187491 RepID=A0A1Q2HY82_9CORY|nr:Abi-like protein [Corynebacterium glaucum]
MRGLIFFHRGLGRVEYQKDWLSVEQQIERLRLRGLTIDDESQAARLLNSIGYYRLTGYLYPFLETEARVDFDGRRQITVLPKYREGTRLNDAIELVDFDRSLRLAVLDGVERIEIAARMRIGHEIGRHGPFTHENPDYFDRSFTESRTDSRQPAASKHVQWLTRVKERRDGSDERFVAHFRDKYDDRMPIWALTEILELGQLSRLYQGMPQADAETVAIQFGVPNKKLMASWLSSLNYVRNVAAHHSRLFNRKLQHAPKRPKAGQISSLDHLVESDSPKAKFGTYNALAIVAYLLRSVETGTGWVPRLGALLSTFPESDSITIASMGVPAGWRDLDLWSNP